MSRILFFFLFAFVALGFVACNSTQVFSDYNRAVDFRKYKSFAWIPHTNSQNSFFDNQLVEKNIKHFSNTELLNRGYSIDTLEPDVLLQYHLTSEKKTYTISSPAYSPYGGNMGYNPYGYNPYGGYNSPYNRGYQQVEYLEGTLLIDVIDRRTNELIWRGWSIGSISNEAQVESELPSDVHRIFSKYPIHTTTSSHGSFFGEPLKKQQIQPKQQAPQPTSTPSVKDSQPAEQKKKAKKTRKNTSGSGSDEI